MRSVLLATVSLLLTAPAIALQWEYVQSDIERFQEDLDADAAWRERHDAAAEEHDAQELFPVDDAARALDAPALATRNPFLVITVDGIPVTLADVPSDAWFAPYVRFAAEQGIVSGYRDATGVPLGLFGPGDPVTIEQLAKIALQTGREDQSACPATLKNPTAAGRWSERFIRCAEGLSWAVYADGSVPVDRPATRAEVVATLLQALEVPFLSPEASSFTDVTSATQYRGAIERAAKDGIVGGYTDAAGNRTGLFGPEDPVNRAQVAKILSLAVQIYGP